VNVFLKLAQDHHGQIMLMDENFSKKEKFIIKLSIFIIGIRRVKIVPA
jgi:hypothetical protein